MAAAPGGAERYFTRWYKPGTARRAGAGPGVVAAAAACRSLVFVPCCRREGAAVRGLLRAAALQQASVGLWGLGGAPGAASAPSRDQVPAVSPEPPGSDPWEASGLVPEGAAAAFGQDTVVPVLLIIRLYF